MASEEEGRRLRTLDSFSDVNRFVNVVLDDLVRVDIRRRLEALHLIVLWSIERTGNEIESESKTHRKQLREGTSSESMLTSFATLSVRKLNGFAGKSPFWTARPSNRMLPFFNRGGVPVLRRPSSNPASRSDRESEYAAGSPIRPNGVVSMPMWVSPPRNVPVEMTMLLHGMTCPSSVVLSNGVSGQQCLSVSSDEKKSPD